MADEPTLDEKIKHLINNLKQGNLSGSYIVARNTLQVLRDIIIQAEWTNIQDLMDIIRTTSHELIQAQLSETCVRNMVQRVLKIIREEHAGQEGDHQESLQKLLLAEGATSAAKKSDMSSQTLKEAVLDSIGELLTELESSAFNIAAQASHYIHTNEVIMTTGKSKTVQSFLKKAAKKIKFQVIVVERAPFYDGQEMALSLAKDGIKTTVITDSAVFAVMARVNKVIIGTHTVMANGGLKAVSGSHAVALAAKYYSIPLIVCAAMFKLSPQYLCSYDQDAFNKFVSPHNVLQFSEGELLNKVQVYNPVFDYVPPELVTSFISNVGGHAPSYVYRLLNELYHPDDLDL